MPHKKSYLCLAIFLFLFVFIFIRSRLHSHPKKTSSSPSPSPIILPAMNTVKTKSGKPPQFIVLSFDGSQSQHMWQDTRAFAQKMNAEGKPLHFTYFVSGVYFLLPQFASVYHPPKLPVGSSAIGYALSPQDLFDRIRQVNGAISEGHEIGSHANGHFDGSNWSVADWDQEFNEFNKLLFHWRENNHLENASDDAKLNLQPNDVVGFRAPLLAKDPALYQNVADHHFVYDSSKVTEKIDEWPHKDNHGIWWIALPDIPMARTSFRVIAMDYNFYSIQSGARDRAHQPSQLWKTYYQQMLDSYVNYFDHNYATTRAPIIIGHHFSLWNDGVYWQVMQDFAEQECGKPEVYCVTFKELVRYMESHPEIATSSATPKDPSSL